jgi:ferredoxin/flavodoxin
MGPYKKIIIYYFTGTGNSKNVALWVAESASRYSVKSELHNIACIDRLSIEAPASNSLIVFVSPVHGFNYPPVMLNFISRFPKGKNNVLLMNTRAGMLIGKWITPGLTGIAFYFSAAILILKGYSIKGMIPVDMPSNWISLHPGLNERTIKYLHIKNKERVLRSADKIIPGGKNFKALREILPDVLVSPIAIGYYFAGRFMLSKTYYASKDCNNCGICYKNCPVKAIVTIDHRPFWSFRCESCMRCMSNCPKKAIETAHGFIIGYSIIFSSVILKLFYRNTNLNIGDGLIKGIIETVLFLALLSVVYRFFHYCMRYRWFERMIVYTSLTKYKWWGRRYKALDTSD